MDGWMEGWMDGSTHKVAAYFPRVSASMLFYIFFIHHEHRHWKLRPLSRILHYQIDASPSERTKPTSMNSVGQERDETLTNVVWRGGTNLSLPFSIQTAIPCSKGPSVSSGSKDERRINLAEGGDKPSVLDAGAQIWRAQEMAQLWEKIGLLGRGEWGCGGLDSEMIVKVCFNLYFVGFLLVWSGNLVLLFNCSLNFIL